MSLAVSGRLSNSYVVYRSSCIPRIRRSPFHSAKLGCCPVQSACLSQFSTLHMSSSHISDQLPDNPGLNASILVNTTGVRTNINCEQSTSLNLNTSTPPYYNITAQGADGCSATVQFNISASSLDEQQYGSAPANAQNCGLPADTDIDFLPLMFWFYNTDAQNIPQAAAVICRPQIQLFNVMANVNLNNGSLVDVTILNNYTAPNNVSGDPLDGKVYNASVAPCLVSASY